MPSIRIDQSVAFRALDAVVAMPGALLFLTER